MALGMTIGALSEQSGVKIPTIRYYEQIGVLPPPDRTQGNQRRYDQNALDRLRMIRHARSLGFDIDAIRDFLELASSPDRACAHADDLAMRHLLEIEAKISKLSSLRDELRRMVRECEGGNVETCRVLQVLSDHELCKGPH